MIKANVCLCLQGLCLRKIPTNLQQALTCCLDNTNLCSGFLTDGKEEVYMCASVSDPMYNLTLTSTSLLACSRNTWAYSLTSFSLPLLAASMSTNRGTLVSRKESEMWSITAFLNCNRQRKKEGDVAFNQLGNNCTANRIGMSISIVCQCLLSILLFSYMCMNPV